MIRILILLVNDVCLTGEFPTQRGHFPPSIFLHAICIPCILIMLNHLIRRRENNTSSQNAAYVVAALFIVLFAGCMSGLTLGLMSLDIVELEVRGQLAMTAFPGWLSFLNEDVKSRFLSDQGTSKRGDVPSKSSPC